MPINLLPMRAALAATLLIGAGTAARSAHATPPSFGPTGRDLLFSPYKYVPRNFDAATNTLQVAATGKPIPLAGRGSLVEDHVPNLVTVTLAFATGDCGNEDWGVPTAAITKVAIPALSKDFVDYVISTGGQGKKFTCASPKAFADFVRRYQSPFLQGIDFDIESTQTPAEIKALVADAAHAEKLFPDVRFSFTIATWAGSDASHAGLNPLGATVVKAIKASTLRHYTINLMVMDYGKTSPAVCVVAHGACDMGASAIQAAENLQHTWHIPANKIELTPIAGVNDNPDEVFTLKDLDTMMKYAVAHNLAGIHFWSLDRDTPCPAAHGKTADPPICNGTDDPPLAFTRRALQNLGR
ncbi:MAG TPA: hypothetical protein VFJ87_06240 [Rhodanobacteraceae bacterium]|jgi:hypothetical protein|nr:hypothetical protein [Rhodanobacteraceae bacterium]